ncbi:MAG: hypothetical protein V4642_12600 [Bacteroidota bacterium]
MDNIQKSLAVLSHVTDALPSPLAAVETVTNALSVDSPENRESLSALAAAAAFGFVMSRMKDKESYLTFLVAGGAALAGYYGTDLILDAVHKAKMNNETDDYSDEEMTTEVKDQVDYE